MKTFLEWLIKESTTITQSLKQKESDYETKELIDEIEDEILEKIEISLRFDPVEGYEQITKDESTIKYIANFFVWQILSEVLSNPKLYKNNNGKEIVDKVKLSRNNLKFSIFFGYFKDFIIINYFQIKSKLNSTSYTPDDINQDYQKWQESLARKNVYKGKEGRLILDLTSIGWKGWKWVSLDKPYCDQEAKAGSHCGNIGWVSGDNILSLRDPDGFVHLTFIENDGILGQMKGKANSKPLIKYHPPIIELLKLDLIRGVVGGGYEPEKNFKIEDLTEDEQTMLLKMKPELVDEKIRAIKYFLDAKKSETKEKIKKLNKFFNSSITIDKNNDFVLEKFKKPSDFIMYMFDFTKINLSKKFNYKTLDEIWNYKQDDDEFDSNKTDDFNYDSDPNFKTNNNLINKAIKTINKSNTQIIKRYFRVQDIEDVIDDYDFIDFVSQAIYKNYKYSIKEKVLEEFRRSFSDKSQLISIKLGEQGEISIIANIEKIIDEAFNKINKGEIIFDMYDIIQNVTFDYIPDEENLKPDFEENEFNKNLKYVIQNSVDLLDKLKYDF
jgi:hypothetical protein